MNATHGARAAYDVVVVGAGVVGLACAQRLSAAGRSVMVVERHARFGQETSSRNSGVIHAGIYYPAGSLKAELCVRGNRSLLQWCRAHEVPHAAIGKYLVATSADEEAQLEALYARAQANGAVEVTRVSLGHLSQAEPNVRATAALWSPRTGIVDVVALMRSLQAQAAAADFVWLRRVTAARSETHGWTMELSDVDGNSEELTARCVINAAGLDADRVAALAGFDHPQYFVKGNYYRLRKNKIVSHLIYPVPPPDHAGVGVHVTLDLAGGARLGPDVEPVPLTDRQSVTVDDSRRAAFVAAASRYLVGVTADDLSPDQAGIRPKVRGGDFIIVEEGASGWVNLVGIESPGLTSCLEIAERVQQLI